MFSFRTGRCCFPRTFLHDPSFWAKVSRCWKPVMATQWSDSVLSILETCDRFFCKGGSLLACRPFVLNNRVLGFVRNDCVEILRPYKNVFVVEEKSREWPIGRVFLNSDLGCASVEERTREVAAVCEDMRAKQSFPALAGWRNELYAVSSSFHETAEFCIERAAAGMIGMKQYGSHLNGYCWREENGVRSMRMWIGRRSMKKATFPGLLDNIVAGGIAAGLSARDTIIKEAEEEAAMPRELAKKAVPVGTISYFYENDRRGLFPETQFIFDLELPATYSPVPVDGEVTDFYCWSIDEVRAHMAAGEFKPNCALVITDFMIRHGFVSIDNEPQYEKLAYGLRRNLDPAVTYQFILAQHMA